MYVPFALTMSIDFMQIRFFIFVLSFAIHAKFTYCQSISCGNNSFYIIRPFRLRQQGQHSKTKGHSKFVLECNSQGMTVLNLPFSGDFYVRDIDYFQKKIQLFDPGDCLPKRLMNFSLSNSPFVAAAYQNYTLFSCPPQENLTKSGNFSVVSCLSNSTVSVLAAASSESSADEITSSTTCSVMSSFLIPKSSSVNDQNKNNGFQDDFELAWEDPNCKFEDCKGRSKRPSLLSIIILCLIIISIALLGSLFYMGCCLQLINITIVLDNESNIRRPNVETWPLSRRFRENLAWRSRRSSIGTRPSSPQLLENYPQLPENLSSISPTEEMIIGGRQCVSGPNNDSCPICLEEYKASDNLSRICKCDHCFHSRCLRTWLQRKDTCPICRINVA